MPRDVVTAFITFFFFFLNIFTAAIYHVVYHDACHFLVLFYLSPLFAPDAFIAIYLFAVHFCPPERRLYFRMP